jgi:hypothetical protein
MFGDEIRDAKIRPHSLRVNSLSLRVNRAKSFFMATDISSVPPAQTAQIKLNEYAAALGYDGSGGRADGRPAGPGPPPSEDAAL